MLTVILVILSALMMKINKLSKRELDDAKSSEGLKICQLCF